MKEFLSDDFLLETVTAAHLYHEYAESMPIFDYHTHLSPEAIADNTQFRNITHMWMQGDHYKWRLMRANGIEERLCTGNAPDREKFGAWIKTIPFTIGNPVFHWAYMELRNPFGIKGISIGAETEEEIWNRCNALIKTDDFRVRGILKQMKVEVVCTTDDPADSLKYHIQLAQTGNCPARVYPAFRPDRAMGTGGGKEYAAYLEQLGEAAGISITSFQDLLEALEARHRFFHEQGCRLSDHAIEAPVFREAPAAELEKVFQMKRRGQEAAPEEEAGFATALVIALGKMNALRGWTMQLHIGALRNVNSLKMKLLGKDTGFDAIRDGEVAVPLARFLDILEREGSLPKTILYVLNPGDTDLVGALAGCFQGPGTFGKVQAGPAWWFNDHKQGMVRQLTSLANVGLLSRFVGMLTDSRSFLSFSRHDYFRRILCNLLGSWVEKGEAPRDIPLWGGIIQDICFNNAHRFFGMNR